MKKSVVVISCLLILTCTIVSIAGSIIAYLYLRETPEKAFEKASDFMDNGDYYQSDIEMSMEIYVQEYPDMSFKITSSGTKEYDIQADKTYSKSTEVTNGEESVVEEYTEGKYSYKSTDGGEFKKEREDDLSEELDEAFDKMIENEEYTIKDDETVEGYDCYSFEMELNDEVLELLARDLAGEEVEIRDLEIKGVSMEWYVRKDNSMPMKLAIEFEEMSMVFDDGSVSLNMKMKNLKSTEVYRDWGEKVDIKIPE